MSPAQSEAYDIYHDFDVSSNVSTGHFWFEEHRDEIAVGHLLKKSEPPRSTLPRLQTPNPPCKRAGMLGFDFFYNCKSVHRCPLYLLQEVAQEIPYNGKSEERINTDEVERDEEGDDEMFERAF